jgi:hypothetical protein
MMSKNRIPVGVAIYVQNVETADMDVFNRPRLPDINIKSGQHERTNSGVYVELKMRLRCVHVLMLDIHNCFTSTR